MKEIWSKLNAMLSVLSGGLLGVAMIAISVDVCARYFFNSPIVGLVDLVTILIPIFVFLPMANTELQDSHIRVELISSLISEKWRSVFDVLDSIIGIILLGLMTWVWWELAVHSWDKGEYLPGMMRLPVWPSKFVICIGTLLFAIQVLVNCIRSIVKIKSWFSRRHNTVVL